MTRPTLDERILAVFASEPRPDWGFYEACDLIAIGRERNWGKPWQDYEPTLMRLVKDGRLGWPCNPTPYPIRDGSLLKRASGHAIRRPTSLAGLGEFHPANDATSRRSFTASAAWRHSAVRARNSQHRPRKP